MSKIAPIVFILATIAIIGFFDSQQLAEKEDVITSFPIPVEDEEVSLNTQNEQTSKQTQQIFSLETMLIDVRKDDGYTVEVYQEYEVYKDNEGNVIERVPTENYQYLRYKR